MISFRQIDYYLLSMESHYGFFGFKVVSCSFCHQMAYDCFAFVLPFALFCMDLSRNLILVCFQILDRAKAFGFTWSYIFGY